MYQKIPRKPKPPPKSGIDKLRKVAGYKINIKTRVAFLYVNNGKLQREIKKIPFITATKNKTGVNSATEAKVLYTENSNVA